MAKKNAKTGKTAFEKQNNTNTGNEAKNRKPTQKKRKASLSRAQRVLISVLSCVLVVLILFTGSVFVFPAYYFADAIASTLQTNLFP